MDWRAAFNSPDDSVLDSINSYNFLLCNFEKSIPQLFLFNYYNFLLFFYLLCQKTPSAAPTQQKYKIIHIPIQLILLLTFSFIL